jgi:hypothetical protein
MSSGEGSFDHPSPRQHSTGGCLPPLQLQHGRRTLQPQQCFPRIWRSHDRKPTTPPSGIALTMKDNQCKSVLDIPPPIPERCHDEVTVPQANPYHGSARRTTSARACAGDRDDPNGGCHFHSGPSQGVGPSSPPSRGPGQGRRRQIPKNTASAHRRQVGHDVPSTGRNPCHLHRAASRVCSLASDRLDSPLNSGRSKSTKVGCGAIRDKIGAITLYRLRVHDFAMATAGMAR